MTQSDDTAPPAPAEALRRLEAGNARFRAQATDGGQEWTGHLAAQGQQPFAIVLGCSDSRVPVEILFDQGFGDLFVVRVAGNIVAPSLVGSIEFAASKFGSRLVVVLGHTQCGAVTAAVDAIETGEGPASANLRSITNRIAPHVHGVVAAGAGDVVAASVRANVRASADHLRHGSQILEELVVSGQLVVVGAEYDLRTGAVAFFDGVPLPGDGDDDGGDGD